MLRQIVLESLERRLLLEYDHDKEWEKHGENATKVYAQSVLGVEEPHKDALELVKQYGPKSVLKDTLKETDPTPNQKYHSWLLKTFSKGGFGSTRSVEDMLSRGSQALSDFDHHKTHSKHLFKSLNISNDIGSYSNLRRLEDSVGKLNQAKSPETGVDVSKLNPSEYTHIEHSTFHEYIPHTKNASCELGKNTNWCTASKSEHHNMFDQYYECGPLHIFIPKNHYEGDPKKYQVHLSTNSTMNENDDHHNYDALKNEPLRLHVKEMMKQHGRDLSDASDGDLSKLESIHYDVRDRAADVVLDDYGSSEESLKRAAYIQPGSVKLFSHPKFTEDVAIHHIDRVIHLGLSGHDDFHQAVYNLNSIHHPHKKTTIKHLQKNYNPKITDFSFL